MIERNIVCRQKSISLACFGSMLFVSTLSCFAQVINPEDVRPLRKDIGHELTEKQTLVDDVSNPQIALKLVTQVTDTEKKQLFAKFEKLLTGAKLVGMFTVDSRPLDKLSAEEYEIQKVEKQAEGDWWTITARIKYGDKDLAVPVPLEVKWAGTTPVLTLDKITLPGFGTFSSRVVLSGDRYAGTWQHDDKGGHLFGKIILAGDKPADAGSK